MSASTLNPATFPAHATGDSPTSANYNARWNAVVAAVNNHAGLIDTHLDIRNFGARGVSEGVTDSSASIQAALNIGGDIFIPPLLPGDIYQITSPLVISKPTRLFGAGVNSQIVGASSFTATDDVIRIIPAAGVQRITYALERFTLGIVGGAGRHCVHIDLTSVSNPSLYMFDMDRMYLNNTGGRSLKLTNPTNQDGFYTSTIRGCAIHSGIWMERCGDSVIFTENQITLDKCGIELSFTNGAAQIIIDKNNMTSAGGAILLHNGTQVKITNNQIEQIPAYTGAEVALITLKGDTAQIYDCDITGNNINTLGNISHCIDVQGATDTRIEGNTMVGATHVRVGASAVRTVVATSNRFNNLSYVIVPMVVTDTGAETAGPWKTVTVFSNSWVADDAVNWPVRYSKNEAGIVTVEGMVRGGTTGTGTTVFNLPAGYRPVGAGNNRYAVIANAGGVWGTGSIQLLGTGDVQYMSGTNSNLGVFFTFRAAP